MISNKYILYTYVTVILIKIYNFSIVAKSSCPFLVNIFHSHRLILSVLELNIDKIINYLLIYIFVQYNSMFMNLIYIIVFFYSWIVFHGRDTIPQFVYLFSYWRTCGFFPSGFIIMKPHKHWCTRLLRDIFFE